MPTTPTTFSGLVNFIIGIIDTLVTVLFALLFIYIVWKIIDAWVLHGGDEEKREEGKRLVITSVLVLVVMVSIWGIVALIRKSIF
jgi:hypothetical protein